VDHFPCREIDIDVVRGRAILDAWKVDWLWSGCLSSVLLIENKGLSRPPSLCDFQLPVLVSDTRLIKDGFWFLLPNVTVFNSIHLPANFILHYG
jgi:hypothetical protein